MTWEEFKREVDEEIKRKNIGNAKVNISFINVEWKKDFSIFLDNTDEFFKIRNEEDSPKEFFLVVY